MRIRHCSKTSCNAAGVATLTFQYEDSTVVVGTLSQRAEPHSYDLCLRHAESFTAPRGWDVVHLHQEFVDPPPSPDDLDALAHAVREAGRRPEPVAAPEAEYEPPRRGHLRVVSDA